MKTAGKLKADLALKGAEAEPKSLKVWVPEGIEASTEISTEPIDLSGKNESTVLPVKLLLPEGILLEDKMVSVSVALTIEEDK